MENTKIEWATHSFSPWIGCSKVHVGCQNCYAEAMAGRLSVTWGPNGTRRRTAESTWKQVERWNRQAACTCKANRCDENPHWPGCGAYSGRPRVFPSLCDPFEDHAGPILDASGEQIEFDDCRDRQANMADVRRDFFALIDRCPNLDFLLLTKRPENVRRMWPELIDRWPDGPWLRAGDQFRRNVWLLYSASDQASLEAGLPHLLACRDLVPVLGLSLEPLVGRVSLKMCPLLGDHKGTEGWREDWPHTGVDFVIVGGESGPKARPMEISWLASIAEQCEAAGVPLFVKQDSGQKAGQQGRIPDELWKIKRFPGVLT